MAIYLGNTPIKPSGISKVFVGPHQVYQSGPAHTDYLYFKTTSSGTIWYEEIGSSIGSNIQTSSDMIHWSDWAGSASGQITLTSDKLYVRNTKNTLNLTRDDRIKFHPSGKVLMGGNIMSLVNYSSLSTYCFNNLFSSQSALDITDDFIMPATELVPYCYYQMFESCTSLTKAPHLPITTLADYCCHYMFYGCSNLKVNQNNTGAPIFTCPSTTGLTSPVGYMFTSTGGSFTGTPTAGNSYSYPEPYLYFVSSNSATLGYTKEGTVTCNIQTSSDKLTWTDWDGTAITLSNDKLYLRNTLNTLSTSFDNCFRFTTSTTGSVTVGGNITSMRNYAALTEYCFVTLFKGCKALVNADNLSFTATSLPSCCYYGMFRECSSLVSAAFTLNKTGQHSCNRMFLSCTSLRIPPKLTATSLASYCYNQMFNGCSNLIINQGSGGTAFFTCPSSIPEAAVANMFGDTGGSFVGTPTAGNTYYYVEPYLYFTGTGTIKYTINGTVSCNIQTSSDKVTWTNWSVNTTKQLTTNKLYVRNTLNTLSTGANYNDFKFATSGSVIAGGNMMSMLNYASLSNYCFYELFSNCTGLDLASDFSLPWKTLKADCYFNMFNGCTSLKTPPAVLPATTLASECYSRMFYGCTSLLTAPQIKATSFGSSTYCCYMMFYGCSNLLVSEGSGDFSFFKCPSSITTGAVSYMFNNTGGSFTGNPTAGKTYYFAEPYLHFTAVNTSAVTKLQYTETSTGLANLQYSRNKTSWTNWTSGTTLTLSGSKTYIRNTKNTLGTSSYRVTIKSSGGYPIKVGGNIMSLVNHTALSNYCFNRLFYNDSNLVGLNNLYLPAKTLKEGCYKNMFEGCIALTSAPTLPATTLATSCYQGMFYNCWALTTPPTLPATTLATSCYAYMFDGCSLLTTPPSLPATKLAATCYQAMFRGCRSLSEAPALSATTLAAGCYQNIFTNCTSLTTPPSLPVTTLVTRCYQSMFSGCTSLTTAPTLPATSLTSDCYENMFDGCSSLTTAPTLPATTLADYCYYQMFIGCSSLKSAPIISATTLANYSCYRMFANCTTLEVIENGTGTTFFTCPDTTGLSASVSNMFYNTGGEFKGTPTAGNSYCFIEPYLYFTTNSSGTIGYTKNGTVTCNLQTSSDKINWSDWDGTAITLSANKLYVRNTLNTLSTSNSDRVTFATTGSVLAGGNCNSMVNHSALSDYCFYGLFATCSTLDLTDDFSLPATTLATYCYGSMFMRCTSLTNPPSVLPATTLAERCYGQMFWGCTSLTKAPSIPATTLATNSCGAMFGNCSSLNVSENSGGTAFFTCPDMTGVTSPVVMMFDGTGGSFTEDPTTGNTYYYNQPATLTNNESLKNYIQSNNITSCSICKHSEVPEGTTDVTSSITGLSNGYAGVLNNALYISGLDDSMVIAAPDMSSLFGSANVLTSLSVSNLDTRNVTNMEGMFVSLPYVTTLDVSNFNTSNVTNMSSMFNMDSRLQTIIGLENFDTSKVIYFSMMFSGCAALTTLDLTSFSSDNCQYIFSMFEGCTNLANIYVEESWYPTHTGSVQSGSGKDVFKDCPALPGYSSTATNSYAYCRLVTETENPGYFKLKPAPTCTLSNDESLKNYIKNTASVTAVHVCKRADVPSGGTDITSTLTGLTNGQAWLKYGTDIYICANDSVEDVVYATEDMSNLFTLCRNLKTIDLGNLDTSNTTNMQGMFDRCGSSTYGVEINVSNFDTSKVTNMYTMFYFCPVSTLDVTNFNTSKVTDMAYMFMDTKVTSIDLSNFDVSNVTTFRQMFNSCSNLEYIYVNESWYPDNIKSGATGIGMFTSDKKLPGFDSTATSVAKARLSTEATDPGYFTEKPKCILTKDTSLQNYIKNNSITECYVCKRSEVPSGTTDITSTLIGLSNGYAGVIGTKLYICASSSASDVVYADYNMGSTFVSCTSLQTLDLDNLDTSNVTNMSLMFYNCQSLTSLNVSKFNTSNVTTMMWMFEQCRSLTTLDLSSFNIELVSDFTEMFMQCAAMTTIYVNESWYPDHIKSGATSTSMFYSDRKLPGYDSSTIDITKARLSTEATDPGYFTLKP